MSSYCLRRNNHCFDLAEHFEKMFKDESMVDVTLSCGDGAIKAHRMILSACSSYFKMIFSKFTSPHQYPVIIIKDMPFEDLRAIIEFIYRGEVTVGHQNLKSVLRSAEALKVKGLSDAKRQMDGEEAGGQGRRKKRKRRRKSRKIDSHGKQRGDEMDDENGERTSAADGSNLDKENNTNNNNKEDNSTEDDDATDYTEEDYEDDETEKEDDNTSIIVTEREETARIADTNSTADAEIEPARLLEQSMITGDQDRGSSGNPRFQAPMGIPHQQQPTQQQQQQAQQQQSQQQQASLAANISQAMRGECKNLMFGEGLLPMNVAHPSSLPNNQHSIASSSHNHVPGISLPSYEASSLSMPGPSTISPITPRPIHHGQDPDFESGKDEAGNYGCPNCHKKFNFKYSLLRHYRVIHDPEHQHHICNCCGRAFNWKSALLRHKNKHSACRLYIQAQREDRIRCTPQSYR